MRRITGDASPWLCWTSSPNESLAEPLRRTAGGSKHTECDSPGVRRWLGTLLRRHVYGTVRFEPAFRFLYHHAIAGLFMVGETFEGTGEAAVLDSLRSALPPEPIIVDVGAVPLGPYAPSLEIFVAANYLALRRAETGRPSAAPQGALVVEREAGPRDGC